MKKRVSGELTVFYSLVFFLIISLIGAIMESVEIQVSKNEKHADTVRAMESVFAEYQTDLLNEYGIFGLEAGYETGTMSEANILNRLSFWGTENMESEIVALKYLTDQAGEVFYNQAVRYEKEKTGVGLLEEVAGYVPTLKQQEEDISSYGEENEETSNSLNNLLTEQEQELPEENNPIKGMAELKGKGMLTLLVPDELEISQKELELTDTVSKRNLQKGYGNLNSPSETASDTLFFQTYILEKFGCASKVKEDKALDYELEYLLEGRRSDRENLESVLTKLSLIRFAANYSYIQTDMAKKAEAEAMAATLCTLIVIPEIEPIVKQAILLAWAYGEAVVDVKTLVSGKKVPVIKSSETWQLSLENLVRMSEEKIVNSGENVETGLSYQNYLQGLLMLESKKDLTMRSLDLIEMNMNNKNGANFFRADQCVAGMKVQMNCPIRWGIEYQFECVYQYH